MTKDELIVKQQLQIELLNQKILSYDTPMREVHNLLFSVGAPLNDNYLQFNEKQLEVFYRIAQALNLI
jgi:hypothetical protein